LTVPLCTGAEVAGAAYLGVVAGFSPPEGDVLEVVVAVLVLLLDSLDPQPAANTSAEQAITTTGRPLLIGTILSRRTLRPA
jgi:hypothetical protein